MRILVTGSSGQIGTNLGQRLLREGHDVFGIDKRLNTWTDDFRYLLQDLSGHYPSFPGGIGGVDYPEVDLVVHLAAHAKVHQLVRQPHRALENAVMTFNVLEFCRQQSLPIVFSSSREVYGDVHRFAEEQASEASADFAYTESTYSASKIAGEAFVYSYARCYGLRYLVFRFSNVYGRYDNDLARMVRVLPLFIHTMLRNEPVTVFGQEKTLDFTYVDDCIDGITRGIEALADGRVVNETINLAYGHGNSLVHAAELIAGELGVEPKIALAPSLLGEVTHYVADLTKARELLGYEPSVPLEEGISRSVAWFREHRAAHPEENGPLPEDALFPQDADIGCTGKARASSRRRRQVGALHQSAPSVLAIFGPTASGKTAVAEAVADRLEGEVLSADSMQAYRGLPILTAQPERPTRLVGIWPLAHEGSVAEYARLAHAAIDELMTAGRTPVVTGGTGLYLRAALAELELPPAPSPGQRARWEHLYDRLGPERAYGVLAQRDPGAAARLHPNDRRRIVRALELTELGSSLQPAADRLWTSDTRRPTLIFGLDVPRDVLTERIEQRARSMFAAGVVDEARAALAEPISATAVQALGLRDVAELAHEQALEALVVRTRRYAAYQRKWMRRIPDLVSVNADRPVDDIAHEIVEVASARQRLPAGRAG